MKSIEVIIGQDGSIKIDAVGFKGADCQRATEFLERALGRVSTRQKKPAYHQRALTRQQVRG